jgi:hypothetical protein
VDPASAKSSSFKRALERPFRVVGVVLCPPVQDPLRFAADIGYLLDQGQLLPATGGLMTQTMTNRYLTIQTLP